MTDRDLQAIERHRRAMAAIRRACAKEKGTAIDAARRIFAVAPATGAARYSGRFWE